MSRHNACFYTRVRSLIVCSISCGEIVVSCRTLLESGKKEQISNVLNRRISKEVGAPLGFNIINGCNLSDKAVQKKLEIMLNYC